MNRLMRLLVILVLAGMLVPGAQAITDPDPDLLGVFFDIFGDQTATVAPPTAPFLAYFILTNPVSPEILGYEFSYHLQVDPAGMESSVVLLGHFPPPGIIEVTLPVYGAIDGEVLLSWPAPVPTASTVILMTFQYMLVGDLQAQITTGPVANETVPNGLPAYWDGTGYVFSLGRPDCSGLVNSFCGVAVETQSFSTVKALYR